MIRVINDTSIGVNLNLAMEHAITHLAHENKSITMRFWRNEPSVILGRNQILENEVNLPFCTQNNIHITRRMSGGGAVYHDLGNLNSSFLLQIQSRKSEFSNIQNIAKYLTELQLKCLNSLGYNEVSIRKGTNILYKDRKISGSAGYYFKSWYIHHATLLLDTNLGRLENSLLVREENPVDKKSSKYYPTINLGKFDQDQWITNLGRMLRDDLDQDVQFGTYYENEVNLGNKLLENIYLKKEWIYKGKRKI